MLIFGYLNRAYFFQILFGDGIWYFKYQILFASLSIIIIIHDKTQQINLCYLFVSKLQVKCSLSYC